MSENSEGSTHFFFFFLMRHFTARSLSFLKRGERRHGERLLDIGAVLGKLDLHFFGSSKCNKSRLG